MLKDQPDAEPIAPVTRFSPVAGIFCAESVLVNRPITMDSSFSPVAGIFCAESIRRSAEGVGGRVVSVPLPGFFVLKGYDDRGTIRIPILFQSRCRDFLC